MMLGRATMRQTFAITLLALLLIGCGTSESAVQTAIAETEVAKPTFTSTVLPTDTPTATPSPTFTLTPSDTPTETPSPTVTETPTPIETLTPTPDLRVIEIDPRKFLLESADMPEEGKYFLPDSSWISPHHNAEIISGWGTVEGREYLDLTKRIDGWLIYLYRGTNTVIAPEIIYHNIIQYEAAEGARLTVVDFNWVVRNDPEGYKFVDRELEDLGDVAIAMAYKEMQPNGKNKIWYVVEYAYRNYVSTVAGVGWEEEVEYDYVEDIARITLEKLKSAPLVDEFP